MNRKHINASQHIYHHNDDQAKVSVKVEKNSRGMSWEVSVSGAATVDQALSLVKDAEVKLAAEYGQQGA
jgi:hypothetical protein